jgi:hypothetical protein
VHESMSLYKIIGILTWDWNIYRLAWTAWTICLI